MIAGYEHAVQVSVLAKAVGMGYILGLLFCFFTFVNALSKSTAAVFVRDILFFVLNAGISFLFLLKYNSGVVRFYILAGETIGFLLYYLFPGVLLEGCFRNAADMVLGKLRSKAERVKKRIGDMLKRCFEPLKNKVNEDKTKKKTRRDKNRVHSLITKHISLKVLRKKGKKNHKNT